jgi:hypothetical protein
MKQFYTFATASTSKYYLVGLVFALMTFVSPVLAQNRSFLGLDGGFEGTATIINGSTNAAPVATNWTKSTTEAIIDNETTTVRSGTNSLRVRAPFSNGTCRVFSPSVTISTSTTRWQIQYYRRSVDIDNNAENQTGNYRDGTETLNGTYSSVSAADTWEKVTYSPTQTTAATTAAAHLLVKPNFFGGNTFYDDFVVYESATVDSTAPDSATAVTISGANAISLNIGWTAPTTGVDGGGYMAVRYATLPNANNDPIVNGIYAAGNTITRGTGALAGTVAYVGTDASFLDTGLTPGVTYYYKVYTFDKAYNYAAEAQQNATTLLPTITSFSPSSICVGSTVTITGNNFTGATAVGLGGIPAASFTVDSNSQITAVVGAQATGRVRVLVAGVTATSDNVLTVNIVPAAPPAITPQVYVGTATIANLTAKGTNLKWYENNSGGAVLAASTNLVNGNTYFVSQSNLNGCESSRTAVVVRKNSEATQTFCSPATVANLVSTPSVGATAQWFTASSGGIALANTDALTNGTYYVEQTYQPRLKF